MPMAKNPEKKDSVRRAQNKYQLANFKVVGCKLPIETANRFIEKVKRDPDFFVGGKEEGSVNAAFVQFVTDYMNKHQQ